MKTVIPMTAEDAAGLVRTALLDPDPVMVFLPAAALPRRGEVPDEGVAIPLGVGRVAREGADVTVVAIGAILHDTLDAADEVAAEGIEVEVIDPRSLLPFDFDIVARSVEKTGRLIACDDASRSCGIASEIVATLAERCHGALKAPAQRVTRPDIPVPFSHSLEAAVVPGKSVLASAMRKITGIEEAVVNG